MGCMDRGGNLLKAFLISVFPVSTTIFDGAVLQIAGQNRVHQVSFSVRVSQSYQKTELCQAAIRKKLIGGSPKYMVRSFHNPIGIFMSFELSILDEEEDEIDASISSMFRAYSHISSEKAEILRPILRHVISKGMEQIMLDLAVFMILYISEETGNYEMLLEPAKLNAYLDSDHVQYMVDGSTGIELEFSVDTRDNFFSYMSEQYIDINDKP
jgi:hypothetical protein